MNKDQWEALGDRIDQALDYMSYGTGDYAILTVALAVVHDHAGHNGALIMQDRWSLDFAKLRGQRKLIES